MGRKGIGKLSLFSIADKIYVYSKKNEIKEAFLMDADEIRKIIKEDEKEGKAFGSIILSLNNLITVS